MVKTLLPGKAQGDFGAATAAPAIFERFIVVPGFEKDVWGFERYHRRTSLGRFTTSHSRRVWP